MAKITIIAQNFPFKISNRKFQNHYNFFHFVEFVILCFLVNGDVVMSATQLDHMTSQLIQEATMDSLSVRSRQTTISGSEPEPLVKCPFSESKSSDLARQMADISQTHEKVLNILVNEQGVDSTDAMAALTRALPNVCQQPQPRCIRNQKYRTMDGTCNNEVNTRWGSSNQPLRRLISSAYGNGRDTPRTSTNGFSLPNARAVSNVVHPDFNLVDPFITHMVPIFGQFVDHDLSLTAEEGRDCCNTQARHPDCWKIDIPPNDPFFSRVSPRQTCLSFTRSTPFCFRQNGIREQMNIITAFIDCSHIYGSANERTTKLRAGQGLLKTHRTLRGFMPLAADVDPQVSGTFIVGDDRVNENPALGVLQNLFLMEHNRIATELRRLNPTQTPDTIFQETRRILGAEFQQIIYNEYLPVVLGRNTMQNTKYNLQLTSRSVYDPNLDPGIFNSFATAAYRFGHTLVSGDFQIPNSGRKFKLRDNFMDNGSKQITRSNGRGYDWILQGLMNQKANAFDPFITDDLRNFLFKQPNNSFGGDLIARNIQRGRDHGLPPYNDFRVFCGLPQLPTNWPSQAPLRIRNDAWTEIRNSRLYNSPRHIDLFTGGLIEIPESDGLTGQTFNCIKALQFKHLKFGDRFFFTHKDQAGSFTNDQLVQLRRRNLGDIICENSQQRETQRNVFIVQSSRNPTIRCDDPTRSKLNLRIFQGQGRSPRLNQFTGNTYFENPIRQ